jgi:DNA (cytosine-5)-methyltransferase 1
MKTVDYFSGCGGASEGFASLGDEVVGVEVWKDAAATHLAAGHPTIIADVRTIDPHDFHDFDHFHASPPCTTFSAAGRGHGRRHVTELAEAVKRVLHGEPHGLDDPDETTLLTLEPARFLAVVRPSTISFEQVRAVLPVWEAYADGLRDLGYSAWTGLISAETLGLPQTRVRAWLGARRDGGEARPPTATHSAYYPRTPERLDDDVEKWVSMAEALGWGMTERPSFTVTSGGADTGGAEPFATGARRAMMALATGRDVRDGRSQSRDATSPSPTVCGQSISWAWKRPATTVCGDPRLSGPGRNDPTVSGSQFANGLRLEVDEALVLQGFPADYPLAGSRTSAFKQVGNAVPPLVAAAVLRELRS